MKEEKKNRKGELLFLIGKVVEGRVRSWMEFLIEGARISLLTLLKGAS